MAMFPWPDAATEGIQKNLGPVAAPSNRVPAWNKAGVPVKLRISYQRTPSRPPPIVAAPAAFTSMAWAVQRLVIPVILFLVTAAETRRSSTASSLRFSGTPACGTRIG